MLSARASDCPKFYSKVPVWWAQYEAPGFWFVPTSLILSYYNAFAVQGSPDDISCFSTVAWLDYVFTACAMFIFNAKDEPTPRYYKLSRRVDHWSLRLLILLSYTIFDSVKYLRLYRRTIRVATNPVRRA